MVLFFRSCLCIYKSERMPQELVDSIRPPDYLSKLLLMERRQGQLHPDSPSIVDYSLPAFRFTMPKI
jgi:hypothetical protein